MLAKVCWLKVKLTNECIQDSVNFKAALQNSTGLNLFLYFFGKGYYSAHLVKC